MLAVLGDTREQFPARKWDSNTSVGGHDRKHWERTRAKYPLRRRGDITVRPNSGEDWIVLRQPTAPWKGTVMVGEMSGYYEPEWDEETAYEALQDIVFWHFAEMTYPTDATGDAEWPRPICHRDVSTPNLVFDAARAMLIEKGSTP